jgi:hypothetical protein
VIVLSQKGVRKFLTIPLSFVLITPKVEAIKLDATADHCMLYLCYVPAVRLRHFLVAYMNNNRKSIHPCTLLGMMFRQFIIY